MAREEGAASDEELDQDIAGAAVYNVSQYLRGVDFPASREDLINHARENGADESAIGELEVLGEGKVFRSKMDLFAAIGEETEPL